MILTDAEGMTLYIFDNDTDGSFFCNDDRATNWPPLAAADDMAADDAFTIVESTDWTKQ